MRLPLPLSRALLSLPFRMIGHIHSRWKAFRRRRRLLLVAGLSFTTVLTAVILVIALARARPAWWTPLSLEDPAVAQGAEILENAVVSQTSLVRPSATAPLAAGVSWQSDPWSVAISQSDANAWLIARLPRWLANQDRTFEWPANTGPVQLYFRETQLRVGLRIVKDGREQIVAATATPTLDESGALWLNDCKLHAGRLGLPSEWSQSILRSSVQSYIPPAIADSDKSAKALDILTGKVPLIRDASLRLGDGRRVRLLKIVVRDGRVELTCRTERK